MLQFIESAFNMPSISDLMNPHYGAGSEQATGYRIEDEARLAKTKTASRKEGPSLTGLLICLQRARR